MLCLACTMPFVASGENCLTSDKTNGEGKKTEASPLNNEAKKKSEQLRQKQTARVTNIRGQNKQKNVEAEWRRYSVFFLFFFSFF